MLKRKKNLTKGMSCQFFNKSLGTPSDPNAGQGQRKTKHVLQGSNSTHISSSKQFHKQESCAVAKMTAQCALYGALKMFMTP